MTDGISGLGNWTGVRQDEKDRQDAERYRWLRTHLEYINFEGLTTDTCDVGLDHIIDAKINRGKKHKPDCTHCDDKGFVRVGAKKVVPCPYCNPDGQELEGEPS